MHIKTAKTDHLIQSTLTERWSPYAFQDKLIPRSDLLAILEAARWAASAYNEQPWNYIVASRDQEAAFAQAVSCLVEPNQAWAKNTSAILLTVVRENYSKNGKANGTAEHDTGIAAGNICVEATARGISVHQMAGIIADRIRQVYALPEGLQPLTAIALGYAAEPDQVPDALKSTDLVTRSRRPLAEFVFSGKWGQATDWLD